MKKSFSSDNEGRAQAMALQISDVLDTESDPSVIESTMAFVAAMMCIADVDLCGVPAEELARRHSVNILEQVRLRKPLSVVH